MRLPGFTAENSTYPTLGHYAGRSFFSSSMPAVVQPQMRRGGAERNRSVLLWKGALH